MTKFSRLKSLLFLRNLFLNLTFLVTPLQKLPPEVFHKKAVPKHFPIFTGKHQCWSLFLIKLVFFCEYCKTFKNTYFEEHLRTTASVVFTLVTTVLWKWIFLSEAATVSVLSKKVFLEISQNSQENICARVSFLIKLQAWAWACNFIKKETQAQMFSCEFCEISKNTFLQNPFELLLLSCLYNIWIMKIFKNQFFRIRSVQDGLAGFLQQVDFFIKLQNLS